MFASYRHTTRRQRLLTATYAALVLTLSVLPAVPIPQILDWSRLFSPDKVAHFGVYAVFAVLLAFCLPTRTRAVAVGSAVLTATVFGALMELAQGLSGLGRQADPVDIVANLIGALLGGLLSGLLWTTIQPRIATANRPD